MAFASTVTKAEVSGRSRRSWGTFTNAATDTGGTIATGLKYVRSFTCSYTSHVGANNPKVTLNSASAGQVTIVTDPNSDGIWEALGI